MPGVLMIGDPNSSWRDWLRHNRNGRDLIVADPSDSMLGPPARITLWQGDKLVAWRFYGSMSPLRAPHVLLGALSELAAGASPETLIQLFPYRPGPLLRQLALLIAEVLQPTHILISADAQIDIADWPIGPEEVALEPAFPPLVEAAQRRAQWLRLFQDCAEHIVPLRNLTIEGARLGSGAPLSEADRKRLGLDDALWAEVCGASLFVIAESPIEDELASRALDSTHTSKFVVASPDSYRNLLCSFARSGGEDFGMGAIRDVDFARDEFKIACTAVPPTPVQVLRIGGLRIGADGQELGEIRPWEV